MIYILIAAIILLGAFIVLIALNHFGFIESYHPMKKAKDGQIKVACIGDSITYGCTVKNRKFTKDYCEILDSYLNSASKPEVYLLVPTPLFEIRGKVMWQLRKDIMIHEVYPAIKKIASDKSIPLIDMSKAFENRRELFSDGVHPNSKGSKKFAEIVFESIKQSVK